MKLQEFRVVSTTSCAPTWPWASHYVHKQIDRAIEDTGSLTPLATRSTSSPTPARASPSWRSPTRRTALPKAKRDYDSVELAWTSGCRTTGRCARSYLWSRLYGNYPGLSQSDENGRTSPNVGRLWDYPMMMFDETASPLYGLLPTDRPHQLKGQFIYLFDFGTSVGVNEYLSSGLPVTPRARHLPAEQPPRPVPRPRSDGRTDKFFQTDMFVQHRFKMGGNKSVQSA